MGRYEQKLKARRSKNKRYRKRKCSNCAYDCPYYTGVISCSKWTSKKSQRKEKPSLFSFIKAKK